MSSNVHISVCVCTYQRPRYLDLLLQSLSRQKIGDAFSYSVVVIDNDSTGSARDTVDRFGKDSVLSVTYDCEPIKNISLARNRGIHRSPEGSHIAFIDDDEFVREDWLYNLYSTMTSRGADGVLGPVIPSFEGAPPKWVESSRVLSRSSFKTGTWISDVRYTRTGNVLLARALFDAALNPPFDPKYGETGGEDSEFFRTMIGLGKKFVWCNEAPVFEHVSPDRLTRRYHAKRALLRGSVCGQREGYSLYKLTKSFSALLIYSAFLPFCFLMGQGCFMRYFIKNCDHLGFLLSFCGIRPLTQKV